MVWVYQSLRKVNGPRLLSNIGYTWDFHLVFFFWDLDMDMEMSGVAAWSFFCIDTPPGVLPPDCIPSVFLFLFFLSDRSISTFISDRVAILKIPNI